MCAEQAIDDGLRACDFTPTEVRHERAHCLTLLGDPWTAVTIYEESDRDMTFRTVRDRANFLIIKAQGLAHSGNLDEGVRLAIDGLHLARGYDSPRHISRVQRMYDRLRSAGDGTDPHLTALRDTIAAA